MTQKFLDRAKIFFSAGNGGSGSLSFAPTSVRTPNGGNGGRGGDVYLIVNKNFSSLNFFQGNCHFKAEHGHSGGTTGKSGKAGKNLYVEVPLGIVIFDKNGEEVKKIDQEGSFLFLKGGKGGIGNKAFMTSTRQDGRIVKSPKDGDQGWFFVDFSYQSDIAIIGTPASGKSSVLRYATRCLIPEGDYGYKHNYPLIGVMENYKDVVKTQEIGNIFEEIKYIKDNENNEDKENNEDNEYNENNEDNEKNENIEYIEKIKNVEENINNIRKTMIDHIKFLEIPSVNKNNLHKLKHISKSKIIIYMLNKLSDIEEIDDLYNKCNEYNKDYKKIFILSFSDIIKNSEKKFICKTIFQKYQSICLKLNNNNKTSQEKIQSKIIKKYYNRK
jgi:GTPase involved in cell partitioning and DNA repair